MQASNGLMNDPLATPSAAEEQPEIFWASDPIRPGDTLMIQGHAFTMDTVVEAAPEPGRPMQKLDVVDRSGQCLKALIPAQWKPNVFVLQVSTAAGRASALLNRPADFWWVGDRGDRQTPGGRFRLCGRNMLGRLEGVRVRLTGPRSVDVLIEEAEPYALTAALPADVPPGEYALQAHNGWGQETGWSEPVPFTVEHAKPWPQTVFDVMDFGAKGRGMTDDTAAIQAALAEAEANGGGIVYFPRGRYEVRDTLKVPRFTVLRGEKRERVELLWPDQPKPIVLVRGSNSFGMEELTLAAFNYLDGIESDEGSMATSGDVFLRRIRVRALRYSRLRTADEVHQRFLEATPHSEGGCTVLVGGRNVEITDCDLYGSGRGLALTGVRGGRVSGNTIHNGRYGWYTLSGIDGLVFEDNEIIGADLMSAGGSLNTFYNSYGCRNLYFARNRIRTVFGSDREGTSSDGGGGCHTGPIVSADGVQLVLSDQPQVLADIWYKESKPGMGVYILDGRGAGQWRRVVSQEDRTVVLDRPWRVTPDRTSVVSISTFQGNYILVGNDYSDSTCAIQMFGISIGHVIAGNTSSRAGGFHVWGLCYGSVQPSWYCQMVDNEILEGNGILGPCNETPARDSHIAALGPKIEGFDSPLVRCVVIRRNHLHNNACIELIGAVQDAVVEYNTVENAAVGIHVEPSVAGEILRQNKIENVDQPLIRAEKD